MMQRLLILSTTIGLLTIPAYAQNLDSLPPYQPQQKVAGVLRACGGPDKLLRLWETGFLKIQSWAHFRDEMYSTAQAIGGLYTGTCELGLMPREAWLIEKIAYNSIFGYEPFGVSVATGPFGDVPGDGSQGEVIVVNKQNPITRLTLKQLDGIFSTERTGGFRGMKWSTASARSAKEDIRTWDQLGLTGEWSGKEIQTYGFDLTPNGFSVAMERLVFHGGDKWNPNYREFFKREPTVSGDQPAGTGQIEAVARDPYGIAYASGMDLVLKNPQVKPIAISVSEAGPYIEPTRETYQNRTYPLTDEFFIYVNRAPGKPMDPDVKEFLRYVLSRQGQEVVAQDGSYLSLTPQLVREQLQKLE